MNAMETIRDDSDELLPPSCPSRRGTRVEVIFDNKTERCIYVTWSNFEGRRVIYGTLVPGSIFHIFTYVGHPWIFEDKYTGDVMLAQGEELYIPQSECIGRIIVVPITKPFYSLRQEVIHTIRDYLQVIGDVNAFELPGTLLRDIIKAVNKKEKKLVILSNCLNAHEQ